MNQGPVRRPAVAGQFYAASHDALVHEIENCYTHTLGPRELPAVNETGPRRIIGLVSPHAGYIYSGPTAARGFYELGQDGRPQRIVVISPCHRWAPGGAAVIQTSGAWQTPLGWAQIDEEIASAISAACPELDDDVASFSGEHSLEVQLPFLQHLYGEEFSFVPIMLVDQSARMAQMVGEALAKALEAEDAVIIASTDMTHFEAPEVARRQDQILIERMLELDAEGMLAERAQHDISMCGYGAVAAMLIAAKRLGATAAEVLGYSNSGDVMPSREVVAYLSLKVTR